MIIVLNEFDLLRRRPRPNRDLSGLVEVALGGHMPVFMANMIVVLRASGTATIVKNRFGRIGDCSNEEAMAAVRDAMPRVPGEMVGRGLSPIIPPRAPGRRRGTTRRNAVQDAEFSHWLRSVIDIGAASQLPGAICMGCHSDDVDISDGRWNCRNCGRHGTIEIVVREEPALSQERAVARPGPTAMSPAATAVDRWSEI